MNRTAIALIAGFPVGIYLIFLLLDYGLYGGFNLPFAGSAKISLDQANALAEREAHEYGNFSLPSTSYFHVTSAGVLHLAGQQRHDVIWSTKVDCSFTIIPKDGKDHFVYAVVLTSGTSAYLVAIEDQNGEVIDSKALTRESTDCRYRFARSQQ